MRLFQALSNAVAFIFNQDEIERLTQENLKYRALAYDRVIDVQKLNARIRELEETNKELASQFTSAQLVVLPDEGSVEDMIAKLSKLAEQSIYISTDRYKPEKGEGGGPAYQRFCVRVWFASDWHEGTHVKLESALSTVIAKIRHSNATTLRKAKERIAELFPTKD